MIYWKISFNISITVNKMLILALQKKTLEKNIKLFIEQKLN